MNTKKESMEMHRNGAWVASEERTTRSENSPLAAYEAPKIEVIEVPVEQGFANSGSSGGGW